MDKQCVVGIDVGTSAVKALAADISTEGAITIMGSGLVPAAGFIKGSIVDAPALVAAICEAIDCARMAAGVSFSQAVIGLGGTAIQSYNFIGSIAPASPVSIEKTDIEKACRAAAITALPEDRQLLHSIPTAFWVDGVKEQFEPVGRAGSRLEVETHMVSIEQLVLDELKAKLAQNGINITDIACNAIVGSANISEKDKADCLYLDIGAGVTDIVVFQQGKIRLSASLPLGGDYITNDIMHGLGVDRSHAEEIKRYYAKLDKQALRGKDLVLDCSNDKKIAFDFLYDVIESRIQEIVSLTRHYLSPVLTGYRPDSVFLTGGCSQLPSMLETCEAAFQLPVRILIPDTSREYAYPSNTVCFGLLKAVAGKPVYQGNAVNSRYGIMERIKNLLKL